MKKLIAPLALAALILTGCGAGIEKDATYDHVNDLAAAYEKSVDGTECGRTELDINTSDWVYVNCDGSDFAELFNSDAAREEIKQKNPLKTGQQRLEGSNWVIVADQYKIEEAKKSMGGEVTD